MKFLPKLSLSAALAASAFVTAGFAPTDASAQARPPVSRPPVVRPPVSTPVVTPPYGCALRWNVTPC